MQQKNFVVFILASIAILAGWTLLQNQLWPPRPPVDKKVAKKETEEKPAGQKDAEKKADIEKKQEEKKTEEKKIEKPAVVEAAKPKPAPPVETYTLGSKDTHLQAVLTTRGAGVQKLTLNRFEAADYLGRPVKSSLDLIPEDTFVPSFLMYHYPDADTADPVLGLGEKTWQFEGRETLAGDVEQIKFSTHVPGLESIKITKTYRLGPKDYHLGLLLEFERVKDGSGKDGGDAKDLKFRYQLVGPHGLPVEGEWYTSTFRKAIVATLDSGGLWRDLGNEDAYVISHKRGGNRLPAGDRGVSIVQYAGVATQYFASVIVLDNLQPDKNVDRKKILAWARPTLESTELIGRFKGILGNRLLFDETAKKKSHVLEMLPHVRRHLKEAGIKDNDQVILSYYTTPDGTEVATWIRRGQTPRPYLDDITVRVNSEPIELAAGAKVQHQFLLYNGPVKTRLLGQFSGEQAVAADLVDRYTETLYLKTLTDYATFAFARVTGFTTLLIACTKIMHWLLYYLSILVFGYHGLSIILLTVIVRGLMFPISKKQAMFSIRMQEVAPELKKLQEKYKNDPQAKTQATMELYRKHNVHPLASCWPMLLQLPIFLGLYYALQESISFRLAGFLWMDNLAAPDMLLGWGEGIPLISDPDNQSSGFFSILYLGPFLNLLPIIAVTVMFIQTKIMTPPPTDEQQAMQQKTMQFMMIFMGLIFYKVASGLCIYFIASSLWGLAERKLLPKKKTGQAVVAVSPNGKASPGKGKGKGPAKPPSDGAVQKVKDWWAKLLEDAKKK